MNVPDCRVEQRHGDHLHRCAGGYHLPDNDGPGHWCASCSRWFWEKP